MSTTKEVNLIVNSCIICLANARKYSGEKLRRLTCKYFENVAIFNAIIFYGVILSLFLDKGFLL